MQEIAYHLVDVFTDHPYGGNPLAVFPDVRDLSTAQMQKIAAELNLSESVFIFPPDDTAHAAKLRIFTPKMELPLAGHPTVGTGYVLVKLGRIPALGQVIIEEGVGPLRLNIETVDGQILVKMEQPVPKFGDIVKDRQTIAEMLSLDVDDLNPDYPIQAVSSGVPFLYIPVDSLEAIRRIHFRGDVWEKHVKPSAAPHVYAFTTQTEEPTSNVHSRMFAPMMGISEDPATGAACGPLGAYLVHYGIVSLTGAQMIVNEQGYEMGRASKIYISVEQSGDSIAGVQIGGYTQPVGHGAILVPPEL